MALDLPSPPSDIRQVIQLAVAPVFLLTAVGTTLSVLTSRLARIVDRGRTLEGQVAKATPPVLREELLLLEKRAKQIYVAITLAVISALQVSLLMAAAFAGHVFNWSLSWTMAALFMGSMLTYTAALLCLLGEVFFALRGFRLGIHGPSAPE